MRVEHVVHYQFNEPNERAKERARAWYRETSASDNYSADEVMESLKGLFKAANITLKNWSIGAYAYSSVEFDMGEAGELTGRRAVAWLENNLLAGLRITPYTYAAKRKEYMGYGDAYRIGKVPPCPFTGVCWDDDLLDAVQKSVREGETLKDAFKGLADVVRQMLETECEYQNKDEVIDENIIANEYEFTMEGKRS